MRLHHHHYLRRGKNVDDLVKRVIGMDHLGDHLRIGRRVDHAIGVRVGGGTRMASARKRRMKSIRHQE
jgi:hypothetical protein